MYKFTMQLAKGFLKLNGFITASIIANLIRNSYPQQILQKKLGMKCRPSYWAAMIFQKFIEKTKNKRPKMILEKVNGRRVVKINDMSYCPASCINTSKLDV